jgi:Bacterial extracellular solute-binding protein
MQNVGKNLIIGLFVVGLAGAVGYSVLNKKSSDEQVAQVEQAKNTKLVINGVITSEKESFFKDERVKKIFADNNMEVGYERWASGKIAQVKTVAEFGKYGDFIFPSGIQTTEKVKSTLKGSQAYTIFYSPMVIATWKPIVDILGANGLLVKRQEYQALDMEKFFPLMQNKVKWKDLKANGEYPVNKVVLIYTTDARFSNASKMFMALSGYVYNKNEVITSEEQAQAVIPRIKQLMDSQGHRESSSTNMFADYTSIGMGKTPLIFSYESEYIEYAVKNKGVADGMTILYPSPTLFTKHAMITTNEKALKLKDLLATNEDIKKIAAEYGFRFSGNNSLVEKALSVGVTVPKTVVDIVDPPNYDVLETIVQAVENK